MALGAWGVRTVRRLATLPGGLRYDGLWANTSFEELGVHPELLGFLAALGIQRPTVVQAEAFRPIVRGRDVILRAETGSGKTLAYLLPLVNRIYHLHERARMAAEDPDAPNPLQRSRPWVVLTPTSDLAAQVLAMLEAIDGQRLVHAQSLSHLFRWDAVRATPQAHPKAKERTQLPASFREVKSANGSYASLSPKIRWGSTDIVVTTPVKFCEDLEQSKEDRFYPACVVMDEADALFQGLTRLYLFDIFKALRPRPKIRQLDEKRQPLPEMIPTQFVFAAATFVHVGPFSEGNMLIERFCTADVVETKHFHRLPPGLGLENVRWLEGSDDWHQRVEELVDLLRKTPCQRTLIFVNSLHNCHVLLQFFRENGWPAVSFMKGPRGRMGPRFRDAQKFADGEANVMIATEFGGRGIDWHEVDHVVNFQMPTGAVCWLHRVGRTGRMGKRGLVSNFVGGKDKTLAQLIQAELLAGKDLHTLFSRRRSLRKRLRGTGKSSPEPAGGLGGLELLEGEGELIGYLSTPKLKAKVRPKEAPQEEPEDELATIRQQLLASDSESDAEEPVEDVESQEGQAFSWSKLEEGEPAPQVRGRGSKRLGVRTRNRLDAGRNYAAPDDELLM